MRAIYPPDKLSEADLGKYFGYRDYFHGTGRDREEHEEHLPPISRPHLSVPFKDKGETGAWEVGLSVPIWSPDSASRKPIGVLALMWILEAIPEVKGGRNQKGMLLDTRKDMLGRRGMILQHPYQEERPKADNEAFHPFYNVEMGELGNRLRQRRLEGEVSQTPPSLSEVTFRDFKDPLGEESQEYAGPWLAALAPVLVPDRPRDVRESGWDVMVQEREHEAVQPLQELSRQLVSLAVQSSAVVLLVVLALWVVVWLMQSDSRARRLLTSLRRKLGLPSESAVSSAAPSSSSQASSARLPSGGTPGPEAAKTAGGSPPKGAPV